VTGRKHLLPCDHSLSLIKRYEFSPFTASIEKRLKVISIERWRDKSSSMALRSVRFGVRSRKLSNVGQKFIISSFGRHVKPLFPAAFAVVSTHQPALARVVGYGLFSLCVIHKEGLCPSSGDINRLMMSIERGQVKRTRNQRTFIRNLMKVGKAKGGKGRKWKEVISPYPKGTRA
jgi:hypothetical protein